MDGLELTKRIRTRYPSVPILAGKGEASFHDLIRNGATVCLAKPFDADVVMGTLAGFEGYSSSCSFIRALAIASLTDV